MHECLNARGHFQRFTLAFVSSMESVVEYSFDRHSVSQCTVYFSECTEVCDSAKNKT